MPWASQPGALSWTGVDTQDEPISAQIVRCRFAAAPIAWFQHMNVLLAHLAARRARVLVRGLGPGYGRRDLALNTYENMPSRSRSRQLPRPTPAQEPLDVCRTARAAEAGRGRNASAPVHIPWRGWKDILVRTYQEVLNDRLSSLAASVVFFSLLALFPAIAAGVSSYALFCRRQHGRQASFVRLRHRSAGRSISCMTKSPASPPRATAG